MATKAGMARIEDIYAGNTLWHVYCFPNTVGTNWVISSPRRVYCLTKPKYDPEDIKCGRHLCFLSLEEFEYSNGPIKTQHYLGDCGIGANHNNNRLFITRKHAMRYIERMKRIPCNSLRNYIGLTEPEFLNCGVEIPRIQLNAAGLWLNKP